MKRRRLDAPRQLSYESGGRLLLASPEIGDVESAVEGGLRLPIPRNGNGGGAESDGAGHDDVTEFDLEAKRSADDPFVGLLLGMAGDVTAVEQIRPEANPE